MHRITLARSTFTHALHELALRPPGAWFTMPATRWISHDRGTVELLAGMVNPPTQAGRLEITLVETFQHPQMLHLESGVLGFLAIGQGIRQGRARGWCRNPNSIGPWEPAQRLLLTGAEMLQIPLSSGSPALVQTTTEEAVRWSRTRPVLGDAAHDRLRNTTIGVAGLGRLGGIITRNLAGLGVRSLTLVDPDEVEPHNLGEGDFFTPDMIGHPKVHVWENWLAVQFPHIRVTTFPKSVTHAQSIDALAQCDLLIAAPDHPGARIATGAIAAAYARPLLDVGTQIMRPLVPANLGVPLNSDPTMGADIRLILPGRCLLCLGGVGGKDAEQIARRLIASPDAEQQFFHQRDSLSERPGSLHSLNQLAASLALRMLEDLILGIVEGSIWQRAEFDDRGRLTTRLLKLPDSTPSCFCRHGGWADAALPRLLRVLDDRVGALQDSSTASM